MKKLVYWNIILFLLLLIILIVVLFVRRSEPFGRKQSSFAAEPEKEITGIEFSDGSSRLTLTLGPDGWLVNGTYEVRKSSIVFITRILTEMRIKSPVSSSLFNEEVAEKGIIPVKVKVYENRKLLRSFFVYRTGSNSYGNIMKRRERSLPFIVHVPGFEGDIGSAFILDELFWQPYVLFSLLPSEISSITFENGKDSASSFEILIKEGVYRLSDTHNNIEGWDTVRVKRYISYFTHIPFESWARDVPEEEMARINTEVPAYRLNIRDTKGKNISLSLWERCTDQSGVKDSDRLWGRTGERDDVLVIRYFDADPVLKKRDYFYNH